jgi:uncharacterized protein (DUF58 family)
MSAAARQAPSRRPAEATDEQPSSPRERFVDPTTLEAFGSTTVRARAVVEGVVAGLHRSPHRGSSVEFAEYKEYAPGDDIRHIDWRAVARKERYYVKQFEDETNMRAILVLDTSGSMGFAFESAPTKLLWASTLLAALAHLLLRQGDAPGLVTVTDAPDRWLPPSSARSQLDDICRVLDEATPSGHTALAPALTQIAERVRTRSLVVIASDLLDDAASILDVARVLRRRGLEVVIFHVLDRAELALPWEGLTLFEGMEDDGELLADPDALRDDYARRIQSHLDAIDAECARSDIERFRSTTSEPVEQALIEFLVSRQRRR